MDVQYRAWFCTSETTCQLGRRDLKEHSIRGHSTCLCGEPVHWIVLSLGTYGGDVYWDGHRWMRVEEPA